MGIQSFLDSRFPIRTTEDCRLFRASYFEFRASIAPQRSGVLVRLACIFLKNGVSSLDPSAPRGGLQILPSTLRIKNIQAIPSCSKASGVFSSSCRQPASSPVLVFHRTGLRDSCPDITLFNASELPRHTLLL